MAETSIEQQTRLREAERNAKVPKSQALTAGEDSLAQQIRLNDEENTK
jgi:hypothetical protein